MEKKSTHIFRKEKGQIVVQGEVNLTDIKGNKIETVFSGFLNTGNYTFSWDGKNNATGIYMIQCSSDKSSKTQKIFLMK